jgi:hypothetical protein
MEHPRIERDPKVMMGKPVIRGTRITVDLILRDIAGGSSFAETVVDAAIRAPVSLTGHDGAAALIILSQAEYDRRLSAADRRQAYELRSLPPELARDEDRTPLARFSYAFFARLRDVALGQLQLGRLRAVPRL